MKKVNINGKLSFKKETIAKLNDEQMNVLKGGSSNHHCLTQGATCATCLVCVATNGGPDCHA